ncbi:PorT family protein [Salegentibacter sp. LM13S]|uniref:porin family protein n=1 Tax=Salegentibacter lacus TaxID=2873599 RepID=UPI001CCB4C95|nr:porin family protein [Salegentibacter lacus]MBZ9632483.1 PorT family protein [Salegentibacter lacus]
MKNTFIVITILLLSVNGFSQKVFETETFFGVKAGGNISGIYADPSIDQKIYNGQTLGIVFRHTSEKSLGIQIELNYKQSGWNESLDSTNIYKRGLDFIELPFMTHINFGIQKTRLTLNFGPYVSYLLSEEEEIRLLEGFEERRYYGQNTNNKVGFGLSLGFGISRHTSIGVFQLESRVSASLTNSFSNTTDSYFFSSQILNAELSLIYMLEHKTLKKLIKSLINI